MAVKIKETRAYALKNPVLIEGFPGIGLVGTIAASYLVEKLQMEPLGHVASERFPPMAAIHNYAPVHPARLYQSQEHDVAVLFSEFIIPLVTVFQLAEEVLAWSKQRNVRQIVSLAGLPAMDNDERVFGIASTDEAMQALKSKDIQPIKEGATTGVSGVLLAECAAEGFPAVSLLAPSHPGLLDPRAAARVIESLNALLGLAVDTKPLMEEAAKIEERMKAVMDRVKDSHDHYRQMEDGTMYG